jgi:lipid-A-disaccharide synthase
MLVEERSLKLMLVCGEPSGDQLGAQLMSALRSLESDIELVGVGGTAMAAQGLRSLFPIDATSVMGLRAIVPRLPEIFRRIRAAADFALSTKPDAVVLIDSPEFTHPIAKRLRRLDSKIPIVNYVAPQVWASRQYRARKMARYFDLVLALLPFETSFFERHGLRARFVGHPVVERMAQIKEGAELRRRLGISSSAPILALLPGSRLSEVRPLIPIFRETIVLMQSAIPDIVCLLPAVHHLQREVQSLTTGWSSPLHILEGDADKFAAFGTANAALAASGTVTTELALAGVPMAVAYRLGALTYAFAKTIVRVKYVTLVNLLLDREAVPEFLQNRCRADLMAPCLIQLLQNDKVRQTQKQDLQEAVHLLGRDEEPPSLRAARALLEFVRERRSADQRRSSGT